MNLRHVLTHNLVAIIAGTMVAACNGDDTLPIPPNLADAAPSSDAAKGDGAAGLGDAAPGGDAGPSDAGSSDASPDSGESPSSLDASDASEAVETGTTAVSDASVD
jgi:hypothetical protein